MDLESKEFKIALKEIPKEYKIDEKKVFITGKAVLNKVPTTTSKAVQNKVPKKKKNVDKDKKIVNKKQKKNVNKKYKSKK